MTDRIKIEDATMPQLTAFAEQAMGLEIKKGTNAVQIRGLLEKAGYAGDTITDMTTPVQAVAATSEVLPAVEGENPELRPAAISRPATRRLMSQVDDPRVVLTIHKTNDKTRSRDVTLSVNGVTTRIKRGETVDVPYRVFESLKNAIEKQPVDTGEVNAMGQPIIGWDDVLSYPYSVHKLPTDEEVAKWHADTDSGFQQAAARTPVDA